MGKWIRNRKGFIILLLMNPKFRRGRNNSDSRFLILRNRPSTGIKNAGAATWKRNRNDNFGVRSCG